MAGWFWLIALGLFLVLTGLYIHWTVVLFGALLPFLPVLAELLRRRRNRRGTAAQAGHLSAGTAAEVNMEERQENNLDRTR
jgi:hypothetical protein